MTRAAAPGPAPAAPALAGRAPGGRSIGDGHVPRNERRASCRGARPEGRPDRRRPGKDTIRPAPPREACGMPRIMQAGLRPAAPHPAARAGGGRNAAGKWRRMRA